jgi:hypothetical protein
MEPMVECVARPAAWRYTTRSEWSTDGESTWMRLAKFSLCNRLSVRELMALFAIDPEHAGDLGLLQANVWDLTSLVSVLGIAASTLHRGFLGGSRTVSPQCSAELRYCDWCLEVGFHAAWFQWRVIERCPLHNAALCTGCTRCGAPIPYALGADLASSPLACAACGAQWVERLLKPAGTCTPLSGSAARLMARWERCVGSALARERETPMPRLNGRFTVPPPPAATPWVHVLTLMNRHYDAPPPSCSSELLARGRGLTPHSTLAVPCGNNRAPATKRDLRWPHFDGLFRACEVQVLQMRRALLGARLDRAPRLRKRLLANSLAAPEHWLDQRTAAALGWAIAWTTATGTLAAARDELTCPPALGLAAWLARIPLRPANMSRAPWHALVLEWLREDMALSAWLWTRVAAFMRAKGYYVLRASISHPEELARLRQVIRPSGGIFTSIPGKSLSAMDLSTPGSYDALLVATLPTQPGQLYFV